MSTCNENANTEEAKQEKTLEAEENNLIIQPESEKLQNFKEEVVVTPTKNKLAGIKLAGFFKKPKINNSNESEAQSMPLNNDKNNLANKMSNDGKLTNMKHRLRNFVARKSSMSKKYEKTNINVAEDANAKEISVTFSVDENIEEKEAHGIVPTIKLNDVLESKKIELGVSKAGLASIETLNESLHEQELNSVKNETDFALETKEEKPATESAFLLQNLRSYSCSVDDVLIVLGIILFLLLVSVIGFLLTRESLTSSPLREGRYIDAVTSCGMVEGIKEDGSFAFRSIPYAMPPVGNRRWQPAQAIDSIENCWQNKLPSYNKSDMLCLQFQNNNLNGTRLVGAEDCLYLDIITPHVRYDNLLPVVLLIGADSFTGPSPGILRPSARYARSHDVVFVRPNFRLGPLGFLALETISKNTYPYSSGNYALTDIIMALKWVQLNIKNFGGNPEMVTLVGHRAGATLVTALASSAAAKNLFARVWVSSPSSMFPGKSLHSSEKHSEQFMREINCADFACLINATAADVWSATPDAWLHTTEGLPTKDEHASSQQHEWLVLDGIILKRHPADYWKQQSNAIMTESPTFVMGTTLHEMQSNKLRYIHGNWTAANVRAYIEASRLGEMNLTAEVVERFNCTNYKQLIALITDIRSTCPLLINARIQPGVLFYLVTQSQNDEQLALLGADILAILGRYEPHTVEERRFVSSMQQLFYYYVAHGRIPMYDSRRRVVKIGQDPLAVEDHDNCNYWISHDIVPRYARH